MELWKHSKSFSGIIVYDKILFDNTQTLVHIIPDKNQTSPLGPLCLLCTVFQMDLYYVESAPSVTKTSSQLLTHTLSLSVHCTFKHLVFFLFKKGFPCAIIHSPGRCCSLYSISHYGQNRLPSEILFPIFF